MLEQRTHSGGEVRHGKVQRCFAVSVRGQGGRTVLQQRGRQCKVLQKGGNECTEKRRKIPKQAEKGVCVCLCVCVSVL